ncbi:bifunctional phosphoserine phosphatase/homoserine phosphotransferase ThrH [Puniceicoccus vermicola]|uniref:phosphoserine phosphatase n=1 Tax=Puniceicoccus vermicola TaxID=388746 RepID=A0A7X1E3T5_9BACT|nr:bifunctional phosphoserine phosphatase/homoserine phosphotransferase ThrH [Puniceicoccus vermicola]MBC2601309.1 bifunctional phosphoserine phosphatase/homoserine phosphotransferase ThrH [Puniceicoccus vermicola]
MHLVTLDLEGVLVPEIWVSLAKRTGIHALLRTTRDEPDYDVLMRYRLDILRENGIRVETIHQVISEMQPLEGAREFISWLSAQTRVIILSDTFAQFAGPLMAQLGHPTLFCHELVIDQDGWITDYRLRQQDQKRRAVEAFRGLGFQIFAAGDSYNDVSMLESSDQAILFRPPESLRNEKPDWPVAETHEQLRGYLEPLLQS